MLTALLAPNPSPMTLDGTRTFVLGRRRPVVIDPGPAVEAHLRAIEGALSGAAPAAIVLTHAHADHAAGARPLARRTGAPVLKLPGADAPGGVDRWLADGEALDCDAGRVTVVHTPGHAPDHLCVHWRGQAAPAGGALFVGDLFMGTGDTTLVAPPDGDLADYLASLDRVEALAPGVMHPAHGPALDDPAAAVARYRAHRAARVEQVARALRATGAARPGRLRDAVYGAALAPELRPAAEASLAAILAYLTRAGRARAHPDGTFSLTE